MFRGYKELASGQMGRMKELEILTKEADHNPLPAQSKIHICSISICIKILTFPTRLHINTNLWVKTNTHTHRPLHKLKTQIRHYKTPHNTHNKYTISTLPMTEWNGSRFPTMLSLCCFLSTFRAVMQHYCSAVTDIDLLSTLKNNDWCQKESYFNILRVIISDCVMILNFCVFYLGWHCFTCTNIAVCL